MATTIDKLRELIHDFEQRLIAVEVKCEAIFKKMDEIREKKIDSDREFAIWKSKIDDFKKEVDTLGIETHVYDNNNFKSSARKLIWAIGVPILVLLATTLISILIVGIKGGFNVN